MKSITAYIPYCLALATANVIRPNIQPLEDLQESPSRIISGQPAMPGQFPYQVAIKFAINNTSILICGGALICDSWVLTAAHCTILVNDYSLYFGSVNQSQSDELERLEVTSSNVIVHEEYKQSLLNNDVALLRLDKKVTFTKYIQPIPLAKTRTGANVALTASGWGITRDGGEVSPTLNFVKMRSISNEECADVFGTAVVINSTICCMGNPEHSTCSGDSGGPLVARNSEGQFEHVGVVSFVGGRGCANGEPSGYVRTESVRSWIISKINGTCTLP